MHKLVDGYFTLLKVLAIICLVTMVVLVFGNVVLRYGFNESILISEEISRWAFVWLTFLGAVVLLRERGHMSVDLALRALPSWGERGCLILSQLLMLACSGLFFWGSWQQMEINWNVPSPVAGWSMGLFYGSGVFFGISACLIHLYEIARLALGGEIPRPDLSAELHQ
ncbi:TRAP-type C4-dicarboxylate transport system, small permease component [Ectopseudomonas composti]|jgi:TRAP-type C4-dicarboxylate transport system permease small subunit|uniref:TRAP transporter small permease protein n=2 Tax=Pseudomonadaceae TaxID=135621 RepID=A0A1I5MU52_9GAMM|nr:MULTISPECIES: TRAP transporter small permease [Pseudomonas]EZH80055.1 C4-dicarboxylate ABC transporter permease [Pseudomonas composti]MDU9407459.1 TRAP transporter small permease [Pseudomonas sp. zfem001]PIA68896.1 TRAP transporter small permease [Pseudomonas sediminis]SFP12556.1 TRAP-type C4-dicarboxylate transport system, small permease component [Pseudomonas composti]